jgi:hypothetical protein
MLMMPLWMPTATSRPLVTCAWLTSNWLTWFASSGVMPADLSLPRSVMKSAQLAGGDAIPALAKAALL